MRRRASSSQTGRPNSQAPPRVGGMKPRSILIVVVLPAPFGAEEAEQTALRNRKAEVVHRDALLRLAWHGVFLGKILDLDRCVGHRVPFLF